MKKKDGDFEVKNLFQIVFINAMVMVYIFMIIKIVIMVDGKMI